MNSFTQEVIDHLEYYVYALVNPDDKTIFYIGKGNKNRVFSHESENTTVEEKQNILQSDKINIIKSIKDKNLEVEKYIISFGLSEAEAFQVENALINFTKIIGETKISISKLANIVSGHRSEKQKLSLKTFGRVETLQSSLSPEPVDVKQLKGNKVMFVKIKLTEDLIDFNKNLSPEQMYNPNSKALKLRTLGDWSMSKQKADEVEYILGVYPGSGMIVSAYKISRTSNRYIVKKDIINEKRKKDRYNFADSGIAIDEINGIKLFPNHIKFKGYHFIDDSGNPKRVQAPFTYVGF